MIPTLQVGDYIWVNKLLYGVRIPLTDIKLGAHLRQPRRGEIIVFEHPKEPDKDLIKRVIAVGGDTVEVRGELVYVNGVATSRVPQPGPCRYFDYDENDDRWLQRDCDAFREQIGQVTFTTLQDPGLAPRSYGPTRVPESSVFVLGDNRDNSSDSRYWGFVPLNLVRGRAMVIWWSHGEPEGVRLSRIGHLVE
jgi:signal peptidase I